MHARDLAIEIVNQLFTNAQGEEATRLALRKASGGTNERDLGGLGKMPAIDRTEEAIKRYVRDNLAAFATDL